MDKKVKLLLTGATGSIGGALLPKLAGKYQVVALVRDEQKLPKDMKEHYEVVKGSVWEEKVLKSALEGVKVALFNTLGDPKEKDRDLAALKLIISELKSQATTGFPSYLILTTGTINGGLSDDYNDQVDEVTPNMNPSPWNRSEFEDLVLGSQDDQLGVAVVRPAWVYGGAFLVDKWLEFAKKEKKVLVTSEQDAWISTVHLEDLVSLYLLILENEHSGVFNASEGVTQLRNIVSYAKKAFDAEILELRSSDEIFETGIFFAFAMRKDFWLASISVNSQKIRWKPKHTIYSFIEDAAQTEK